MRAAVDTGIPGIIGTCGGNATCLTCHCYVDIAWVDRLPPPDNHEKTMLDVLLTSRPNSRLTCQINITSAYEGLTLEVPDFQG
jgi:2Fe-2S ferredoxin